MSSGAWNDLVERVEELWQRIDKLEHTIAGAQKIEKAVVDRFDQAMNPKEARCPSCQHRVIEHAIQGCHRCRCHTGYYDLSSPGSRSSDAGLSSAGSQPSDAGPPSSVVGSDGRAEEEHEHEWYSYGPSWPTLCCKCGVHRASTVGPPKDAPAAEDEKPGESAEPITWAQIRQRYPRLDGTK